ncbi:uncharacterized protein LDX57_009111 [Aspergillus melleus]|uniref:uncharacterized protein n=1 Tax=Aspergillus melleus TaxID=138277 RepID=UPI001E8D86EB|nr:uncharacterized protein LDX57_009111 [Aspergillus melleus]KAH8431449.1 hypothetical protein LDX57_009111 [Aspergillus melleus]
MKQMIRDRSTVLQASKVTYGTRRTREKDRVLEERRKRQDTAGNIEKDLEHLVSSPRLY